MKLVPETKLVHESLDRSPGSNWVQQTGQLPAYIQHIANDLEQERGIPLSRAIPIAIGVVKRWARGGGNVDPDTRAKAAAAVAEWEALKAKNRARQAAGKAAEFDPEVKIVRHVRTEAGVRRFGQPLGSIIVRDGAAPLHGLTSVRTDYPGLEKVKGHDGKHYYIGQPDGSKKYVVWDQNDNAIIEADTAEQAYEALSRKMPKHQVTVRKMTPKERAAGKKPVQAIPDAPKSTQNLKKVKSDSEGFLKYHGDDGNDYYVDDQQFEGTYAAYDPKDKVLAEAATQSDVLAELQKIVQKNMTQQEIDKRRSESKPATPDATPSSAATAATVATSEPGKDGKATYRVTDPSGAVHEQRSSRTFTHALIRRNKGSNNYFVSWASSRDNAERESRVKVGARDHVSIVPVVAKSGPQPYKVIGKKGQTARVEYQGKQYDVHYTGGTLATVFVTDDNGNEVAVRGGSTTMRSADRAKDRERAVREALDKASKGQWTTKQKDDTPLFGMMRNDVTDEQRQYQAGDKVIVLPSRDGVPNGDYVVAGYARNNNLRLRDTQTNTTVDRPVDEVHKFETQFDPYRQTAALPMMTTEQRQLVYQLVDAMNAGDKAVFDKLMKRLMNAIANDGAHQLAVEKLRAMRRDMEGGKSMFSDYSNDYEAKREFSVARRHQMSKNGTAMPDGSFPIANVEDLKNAIQAVGRAKDPDAVKAHIKKRAAALGHSDLVPNDW